MKYASPAARLFFGLLTLCFVLECVSGTTKKPPAKPININTANSEELQQVPGIGPATAEKILQMRKSYGSFKSVDDLLSIRGIGKKRLEKMRKYLTVSKSPAPNRAPHPDVRELRRKNPTLPLQSRHRPKAKGRRSRQPHRFS